MFRTCFKTATKIPAFKQFPNRYFSNVSANANKTIPFTSMEKKQIELLKSEISDLQQKMHILNYRVEENDRAFTKAVTAISTLRYKRYDYCPPEPYYP
jgi:hypothetical protein